MEDNKIINFDFQGWPIEKMSIKDILISLGAIYNEESHSWKIPNDILDICPVIMEDDGMGYGIDPEFITEVSIDKEYKTCNIFRDKELDYASVWVDTGVTPTTFLRMDDKEWQPISVDETDEGFIFTLMEFDIDKFGEKGQEFRTIKADELKQIMNLKKNN